MTDRADRDLQALYRDFELRHQRYLSAGQPHFGIIVAKRRASDAAVVHKLLALLDTVTADEMRGQLRYI
jgi:hypothetical protein